jgi:Pvc16 N-terminal domain
MSTPLVIAAVTATLKSLLENQLAEHAPAMNLSDRITVTAKAPDQVFLPRNPETPHLNLFLFNVCPNAQRLSPSRPAPDGSRAKPQLPLDLYYLMTAYGGKEYEAEILLGYAMRILEDTPVLAPDLIHRASSHLASGPEKQASPVELALHPLSIAELTGLWSAFNANYRPSVAYCAAGLLVDSLSSGSISLVASPQRPTMLRPR